MAPLKNGSEDSSRSGLKMIEKEEDDADEGIELDSEDMDREVYDPEAWGDVIDDEG